MSSDDEELAAHEADLAAWVVRAGAARTTGTINAVGDTRTFDDFVRGRGLTPMIDPEWVRSFESRAVALAQRWGS